jgi:hypothetical protein
MIDALIPVTEGAPVGPCDLTEADLALLGAHVDTIGHAYAEAIALAVAEPDADEAFTEAVQRYVESLFSGMYDPADREVPNLPPAAYVKIHEVVIAAIVKAHRRNETKLYQTLMAYLRVSQADLAMLARPAAGRRFVAHPPVARSA